MNAPGPGLTMIIMKQLAVEKVTLWVIRIGEGGLKLGYE